MPSPSAAGAGFPSMCSSTRWVPSPCLPSIGSAWSMPAAGWRTSALWAPSPSTRSLQKPSPDSRGRRTGGDHRWLRDERKMGRQRATGRPLAGHGCMDGGAGGRAAPGAFAEDWLEATGVALGGGDYFLDCGQKGGAAQPSGSPAGQRPSIPCTCSPWPRRSVPSTSPIPTSFPTTR
jgi:hypothetical protein